MSGLEVIADQQEIAPPGNAGWRDLVGITASIGCAIHCAAMPFVIAYLPALGLSFLADEAFHKWMAAVCVLIAIVAFIPGIFKHGSWIPVSLGSVGLVFITVAAFGLTGDCCPSCSANAEFASSTEAEAGCGEEKCECCDSDEALSETALNETNDDKNTMIGNHSTESVNALDRNDVGEASALTQFTPWVTPIGGIFLVAAHLLNRRFGCACRCCGPASNHACFTDAKNYR